jgi:hypothetical protein
MEEDKSTIQYQQVRQIIDHFKGAKSVPQKLLTEFCNLQKFNVLSEGQYEDYVFQDEHDGRVASVLPKVFEVIAQWQYTPEFISISAKNAIREANDDLEWKLAKVLEEGGIVYKEVDIVTRNMAQAFSTVCENAGKRMNNMAAVVLSDLAKQKFGLELVMKDLAGYYRERAKELGIKLHKTQLSTEIKEETSQDEKEAV